MHLHRELRNSIQIIATEVASTTFLGTVTKSPRGMKTGHGNGLRPLLISGRSGEGYLNMLYGRAGMIGPGGRDRGGGGEKEQAAGEVVWRVVGPALIPLAGYAA